MKIAVIGAAGQTGSELVKTFSTRSDLELFPLGHNDIEISDFESTRRILLNIKADIIINTAAFHKVDLCEAEIKKAFEVNAFAVRNLAHVSQDLNCMLVHFSTDYVFDGKKMAPYIETDNPDPGCVYAVSKFTGELLLKHYCKKHVIIRSSGIYGAHGKSSKGYNFPDLMINLAQDHKPIHAVNDQTISPTYAKELARALEKLIFKIHEGSAEYGIYHIANHGEVTWFEFAKTIFDYLGLKPDFEGVTSKEFGAKATRPRYSVLDNARLRALQIDDLTDWRDALKSYLVEKRYL